MAKQFPRLDERLTAFIEAQHLFFVATAAADGRVNVSPKGCDSLRVLGPERVVWLNLTGSGNESAGHVRLDPRMTLMFCSFERQPMILRLYGRANVLQPGDAGWEEHLALFPPQPGSRQVFVVDLDLVQTSCGFAVPYFDYQGERPTLANWAEQKGEDGLRAYWEEKNQRTIDGFPTGILALDEDATR